MPKHDSARTHTRNIGLASITVLPRMCALRPDHVDALAASMEELGLLQPIVVRPRGRRGYYLVCGRHRYLAAKKLGRRTILATVFEDMDDDHALLAEIDENLMRAKLTPAEQAALHVACEEIGRRHINAGADCSNAGAGRKRAMVRLACVGR
jgi:ParB family chromosome partitioning protein